MNFMFTVYNRLLTPRKSFLGIPVTIIARDNVNAFYFIASGLIVVVCLSILLLIYGPKVRVLRSKKDSQKRKSEVTSSSSTSSAADGMKIINAAAAQAELEEEIRELKRLVENNGSKPRTSLRSSLGSGASSTNEHMDEPEQAQTYTKKASLGERAVSFRDHDGPLGTASSSSHHAEEEGEPTTGDNESSG